MYRARFVTTNGVYAMVRGVWTVDENGNRAVRITSVSSDDDTLYVGLVLELSELQDIIAGSLERL